MAVDASSVVVVLAFPLLMYALLWVYVRSYVRSLETWIEPLASPSSAASDWEVAIMPYVELPAAKNAYYADEMTPDQWSLRLSRITAASNLNTWTTDGASFGYSKVALEACLNAAAMALDMPFTKASVKGVRAPPSGASGIPADMRAWDVVACFHRSGRARGWCARLTVVADYRSDLIDEWKFYVVSAAPAGVVSESALLLQPNSSPNQYLSVNQ